MPEQNTCSNDARGVSQRSRLLRLWSTCAVPALARNIHRSAQREPHFSRLHASAQGLVGSALTEWREHEVTHERAAVCFAELDSNRTHKLTAGQKITRYAAG